MNVNKLYLLKRNKTIYYNLKNLIEKRIGYCKKTKDYINAFIMGNKKDIDINYSEKYQKLGVSHLFAISGMHITLISTILLFIFSKFKIKYLLVSLFLVFYMFLTGFSASVIRASLVFIIYSILKLFNIKVESKYILILLFSIFLLINPYSLYDVGFKFSFIVSYSILFYKDKIKNKKNYISKTLYISLVSFIISLPIVVNNFYQINYLSIIFNIIYVPFISFIVFPFGLITYFFPILDSIFYYLIILLENITDLFSSIPSTIFIAKLPFILIILYYLFSFYYLKNLNKINTIILILIIFIFYNYKKIVIPEITFIDVGQGDSTLLRIYDKNILIDTGGKVSFKTEEKWKKRNNNNSICNNTLLPLFKSEGVKKIDYLILTHGDFDHAGESVNLVNNFKVENVIFNNDSFNDLELELIKVLKEKNIKYYKEIENLNINNNKLYFLNNKLYDNENDNSNVIYFNYNNIKMLFMGDAGVEVEKDIIGNYNLGKIDILKVGHHGSKTSSDESFIDEINPKYGIISVGKNNRYGHPNKEVLKNLNNSKIYRTDIDGSIMFRIKKDKLKIETCIP